ncbi:MAG TPA: hypothetical protein VLG27_01835 [Candidatus Saccharimonadia bacterium]|nr:hypothetical protein [Candidatus Saccharimonadia bacterium]
MRRFKEAVKQDIIGFLLFCFLLGAGFIWLGNGYGWIHLSDGDRVNATVLWLTSLAIFWYAYETYQLKQSTADQVDLQEEIMLNEFLPILEPVATGRGALIKNGQLQNLQIRNLGRGPAKYVEAYLGSVNVALNLSLAAGEQEPLRLDATFRQAVREALTLKPATVRMRIKYQDIYGRKFQTEHVVFERQTVGTYKLRQGTWDFKRLKNARL